MRPDWSNAYLTRVLAHEIGHVVELYSIHRAADPAGRRQAWIDARGLPQTDDWWGVSCTGCGFTGPTEDFAETFARWQVHPTDWVSPLAGPPSDQQLASLVHPFFDTGLMPRG